MATETNTLIRRFYGLLAEKNLRHQKDAILAGFEVTSTKELTNNQLLALIETLTRIESPKTDTPKPLRDARAAVLKVLEELDVKAINNNWDHVNNYLKNPRIAGKVLYQCTLEELKALIPKLKAIAKKRRERIEEENRQAANN